MVFLGLEGNQLKSKYILLVNQLITWVKRSRQIRKNLLSSHLKRKKQQEKINLAQVLLLLQSLALRLKMKIRIIQLKKIQN